MQRGKDDAGTCEIIIIDWNFVIAYTISMDDQASLIHEDILEVVSVLKKRVRTTQKYWNHIIEHKHGELRGKLTEVFETLQEADEVYRQDEKSDIFLYYKKRNESWICVVVRHLNSDGFIVTAYLTTKAKRKGVPVWQRTIT